VRSSVRGAFLLGAILAFGSVSTCWCLRRSKVLGREFNRFM